MTTPLEESSLKERSNCGLLFCAGFEPRVPASAERLENMGYKADSVLILHYPDSEGHEESEGKIGAAAKSICLDNSQIKSVQMADERSFEREMDALCANGRHVICDVTGMNTELIFRAIGGLKNRSAEFSVLYTEAAEYYPLKEDLFNILDNDEGRVDLEALERHETEDYVFSRNCVSEYIEGFEGHITPGYPYFLIAFLAFKRSRLGTVLQELEASERVFINGVSPRHDLKWRSEALKMINFDLMSGSGNTIVDLCTLECQLTLDKLKEIYFQNNNRYRYNFVVSPLGSKMQTLACCIFGLSYPNVSFLMASPTQIYKEKYSKGAGQTYYLADVHLQIK